MDTFRRGNRVYEDGDREPEGHVFALNRSGVERGSSGSASSLLGIWGE